MTNFDKLKALRIAKKLTYRKIAQLTNRKQRSVESWFHLDLKTGKPHRNAPREVLQILEDYKP